MEIQLSMQAWIYNAALVGLYNILEYANDGEVVISERTLKFNESSLNNFEEKYFKYFINKYSKIFSFNKIISYEKKILNYEENGIEYISEKKIDDVNNIIENVKRYTTSNSYIAAYELIPSSVNVLELGKKLKKINKKQKSNLLIEDVTNTFHILKLIIEFMKQEEAIKYIGGKNAIYTIIKNGWDGVCFLNRQTKEKNMYQDYKTYFIEPAIEYLNADKSKFKYQCFQCGDKMKDLNNDLSFLNQTGFDTGKKASHVWDFKNDVAVCPICKLVYSCVPAGFTYISNNGIYINDNSEMRKAININNNIYYEIYHENSTNLTYKALVQAIQGEFNDKIKYELADIQLIRYENEKYYFNILSRKVLEVIKKSKEDLNKLLKCGWKEINNNYNVYELVIDRLLNNQNMFTLIQKLLHYKLSNPNNCYYNTYHAVVILRVNSIFLKEIGIMNELGEKDIVKLGNSSGYYLREAYRKKGAVDKLSGISYRLLNSLRTNHADSFMDTILNCYLYASLTVPNVFLDALSSEEEFKTIGYAFVAGLIEGKNEKTAENNLNGGEAE